jgi:hypothetical protein
MAARDVQTKRLCPGRIRRFLGVAPFAPRVRGFLGVTDAKYTALDQRIAKAIEAWKRVKR